MQQKKKEEFETLRSSKKRHQAYQRTEEELERRRIAKELIQRMTCGKSSYRSAIQGYAVTEISEIGIRLNERGKRVFAREGYDVSTGYVHPKAVRRVFVEATRFSSDHEAAVQAQKNGDYPIIPREQVPLDFPIQADFLDTPENRKILHAYYQVYQGKKLK